VSFFELFTWGDTPESGPGPAALALIAAPYYVQCAPSCPDRALHSFGRGALSRSIHEVALPAIWEAPPTPAELVTNRDTDSPRTLVSFALVFHVARSRHRLGELVPQLASVDEVSGVLVFEPPSVHRCVPSTQHVDLSPEARPGASTSPISTLRRRRRLGLTGTSVLHSPA